MKRILLLLNKMVFTVILRMKECVRMLKNNNLRRLYHSIHESNSLTYILQLQSRFRLQVTIFSRGAGLSERLRRWSNKPDVVGSIPVTTEFFLISCDSNQVPNRNSL